MQIKSLWLARNEKKLFMQVTDENEELNQKLKNP